MEEAEDSLGDRLCRGRASRLDGEASTPKPFSSAPRSRTLGMDHVITSHPRIWAWQNVHRLLFASNPSSNPARRSTLLDQHQTSFRPCRTPDQWSGSSGARRSRGETIFDDQRVDRTKPLFLVNWTSYIRMIRMQSITFAKSLIPSTRRSSTSIPTDATGRSQQSRLDLFIETSR